MSERRATAWACALGFAGAIYVASVIITGEHNQNGPWILLVIVFVSAGMDVAVMLLRELNAPKSDDE